MIFKRLYFLVEGDDDERFIKSIISPQFEANYNLIQIWKFSHKKKKSIERFINSIKSMNAVHIFIHDFNTTNCYTQRIAKLNKTYPFIDKTDLAIVRVEIESWYLAGMSDEVAPRLGLKGIKSTNDINKEDFNSMIPKDFDSRIDFMNELLKDFSINTAKKKNNSFDYFCTKFVNKL